MAAVAQPRHILIIKQAVGGDRHRYRLIQRTATAMEVGFAFPPVHLVVARRPQRPVYLHRLRKIGLGRSFAIRTHAAGL